MYSIFANEKRVNGAVLAGSVEGMKMAKHMQNYVAKKVPKFALHNLICKNTISAVPLDNPQC